jgi:signal transduction histidine kinase
MRSGIGGANARTVERALESGSPQGSQCLDAHDKVGDGIRHHCIVADREALDYRQNCPSWRSLPRRHRVAGLGRFPTVGRPPADAVAPEPSETAQRLDQALLYCFLGVRAVHLLQGVICVFTAGRSYRKPHRAALVFAAAVAESAWLARHAMRRRALDSDAARIDACTSAIGVMALGSCLAPAERAASMNWMLPYSVGSSMAIGVTMPMRVGVPVTTALAATYAGTVRKNIHSGGAEGAAALANAASYVGFYGVARLLAMFLHENARQLEEARRQAVERGERLAGERERNRQHRLLHDSALQTLEAIAGDLLEPAAARGRAREAASRLRRALRGDDITAPISTFHGIFEALANDFADQGLAIEVVTGTLDTVPGYALAAAFRDATREALTNVVKHAATARAVVHLGSEDGIATITVRDHGCGFDTTCASGGFGLPESIIARMTEVGGGAEIWSQPERGTRVRIWGPS